MASIEERQNKRLHSSPTLASTEEIAKPEVLTTAKPEPILEQKVEVSNFHPEDWKRAKDYETAALYNPKATRAQYLSANAKYRAENGLPAMSYEEIVHSLQGGDPFKSKEQELKEQKRMRTAERINAIGDVLVNLVNYGRTKAGNPVMNLSSIREQGYNRLNNLRKYQTMLSRQNYGDYLNTIARDRAAEAANDAENRKFQQQIYLQTLKDNNPLNKARIGTQQAQQQYYTERTKGAQIENEYKPKEREAGLRLTGARTKQAEASSAASYARAKKSGEENKYLEVTLNSGKKKKYSPKDGANWVQKAYQEMLAESGKNKSEYEVRKLFGESPTNQEMYDAVTRYESDLWKNQFKRSKGTGRAPLE